MVRQHFLRKLATVRSQNDDNSVLYIQLRRKWWQRDRSDYLDVPFGGIVFHHSPFPEMLSFRQICIRRYLVSSCYCPARRKYALDRPRSRHLEPTSPLPKTTNWGYPTQALCALTLSSACSTVQYTPLSSVMAASVRVALLLSSP